MSHIIGFTVSENMKIKYCISICEIPYLARDNVIRLNFISGLRDGWSGVRVPAGAVNFSLLHLVQPESGAHPASYPVSSTRGSFREGTAAGVWSWPLTSM
jgi:hypothetical protein